MRSCSQSNDCQAHTAYFCGQMHTGRVMSRKCCAFYFLIPWAAEIFSFEVSQGNKCDITLTFSHTLKIWVHSMSTKMARNPYICTRARWTHKRPTPERSASAATLLKSLSFSIWSRLQPHQIDGRGYWVGNTKPPLNAMECRVRTKTDLPSLALACHIICAIMSEVISHVGRIQIRVLRIPT